MSSYESFVAARNKARAAAVFADSSDIAFSAVANDQLAASLTALLTGDAKGAASKVCRITYDAKGRITAAEEVDIQIGEGAVVGLATDLANLSAGITALQSGKADQSDLNAANTNIATNASAISWQDQIRPYVNPKDTAYGAVGNGKQISNGAISSGSPVLTAASGTPWSFLDVGKSIVVIDATTLLPVATGTVASCQSATQITLSGNASSTIASGGLVTWGTDDAAAIRLAIAAAQTAGGLVWFPSGIFMVGSTTVVGGKNVGFVVPGGVTIQGTGFDYSDPTLAAPHLCGVIMAACAMDVLCMLGPYGSGGNSIAGQTGPVLEKICLDGRTIVGSVVQAQSRRSEIRNCQGYWGLSYTLELFSQNTYIKGGIFAQANLGDCLIIQSGGDHKVFDAQFRQPGTTGACIRIMAGTGHNTNDILISRNHMWTGANGVAAEAQGLIVLDLGAGQTTNLRIDSNIIEGVIGPEILLNVASTTSINAFGITNNQFFNANSSSSYPVIQFSGAGGVQTGVITGNTVSGNSGSDYKSFIDLGSSLAFSDRLIVANNSGWFVDGIVTGTAPNRITQHGNAFRNATGTIRSNNGAKSVQNGDASKTAFNIAHGLTGTPNEWNVTAASVGLLSIPFYVTATSVNLVVTFASAPASGTNNVVLAWTASL